MRISTFISAALAGVVLGVGSGPARALEISSPRDLPPAGFTGRQFVDSAGCVFVRAGVAQAVSWVARVDRGGAHLCGYAPTFGAAAIASAAPPAEPLRPAAGAPVATIALTSTPPAAGLAPRPVMPSVAAVAVAAAPVAAAPAAVATPGRYVSPYAVASGAAPSELPTIVAINDVSNSQSICPNLSPVAQRYMLSDGRHVVRCGPQTADPVGYINRAGVPGLQVAAGAPAPARARAQPAALAPAPAVRSVPVPTGYRSAWNDDRLNPYRGQGSAAGAAQMAQMWSDDVPARMVTAQPARVVAVSAQVTYSSKSAPSAQAPAAQQPSGARFVQVGTYGGLENAESSRARLRALGLPVASAQVTQGGRALQIVYAGPFESAAALRAALELARSAGFRDAFAR